MRVRKSNFYERRFRQHYGTPKPPAKKTTRIYRTQARLQTALKAYRESPGKIDMTVSDVLYSPRAKGPLWVRARRRFQTLSAEQRSQLERGFDRHKDACLALEIEVDIWWVVEAVEMVLE